MFKCWHPPPPSAIIALPYPRVYWFGHPSYRFLKEFVFENNNFERLLYFVIRMLPNEFQLSWLNGFRGKKNNFSITPKELFPFLRVIQIIRVLQVLTCFFFLTWLNDGKMLTSQKNETLHFSKLHQNVICLAVL